MGGSNGQPADQQLQFLARCRTRLFSACVDVDINRCRVEGMSGLYNEPQCLQEPKIPPAMMGSLNDICRMLLMARNCCHVSQSPCHRINPPVPPAPVGSANGGPSIALCTCCCLPGAFLPGEEWGSADKGYFMTSLASQLRFRVNIVFLFHTAQWHESQSHSP